MLKKIVKILLLGALVIPAIIIAKSLYFPFVSGKVYFFRFFVQLAFFFWIFLILKKPEYRPDLKNILVISLFLLLGGLILTSFLGVDTIRSFFGDFERGKGVIQFAHWVLYFLMLISVFKTRKDWTHFFGLFIVLALGISVYGFFNYSSGGRLEGTFGNPIYMAGFLIFAIGFSAIFFQKRDYFFGKYSCYFSYIIPFLTLFFLISLFFTKTRGGYTGFLAGFVFFAILSLFFLRKEKKKIVFISISLLVLIFSFLSLVTIYGDSEFVKSHSFLNRVNLSRIYSSNSFKERIWASEISLKAFRDKPILGWGMENFGVVFNKFYDYRIGLNGPWFDRVHNQALQYLVDGGMLLFFFYLFWISSFFYLVFKIFKERKLLALTLGSIFVAYLAQSLFSFDTLSIYLGLFTLSGFTYFQYQSIYRKRSSSEDNNREGDSGLSLRGKVLVVVLTPLIVFTLIFSVWIPYRANSLVLKYYVYSQKGLYEKSQEYLEKALEFNSPYVYFPIRKRASWEFFRVLDSRVNKDMGEEQIREIKNSYNIIVPELEKALEHSPTSPQAYYLLGNIYYLGYKKLGENSLEKVENTMKKALDYSEYRLEYFNLLNKVLILQDKKEEAEELIKSYAERIGSDIPFAQLTLGNFYFVQENYKLSLDHYRKARELGYDFFREEMDYDRYLGAADQAGEYQEVIDMCFEKLEREGPKARIFFNIAVAYKKMEKEEKAKEFFSKALEIDENKKYEKYKPYFQ